MLMVLCRGAGGARDVPVALMVSVVPVPMMPWDGLIDGCVGLQSFVIGGVGLLAIASDGSLCGRL
ncbi:hypothetical protein [Bifidobacterium simiiventris]|uniref:hypothetical protein n=1 Tax=Bifidobacterium simiiventris TaxID=2834434 RepID=UPI001C574C64|nr:hypothetical protein [Bifidobacterium simiiventris]MBW3079162.1 hypothetical protein [Bifidobacterium simiiventris]